jgi:hypothetical protein
MGSQEGLRLFAVHNAARGNVGGKKQYDNMHEYFSVDIEAPMIMAPPCLKPSSAHVNLSLVCIMVIVTRIRTLHPTCGGHFKHLI